MFIWSNSIFANRAIPSNVSKFKNSDLNFDLWTWVVKIWPFPKIFYKENQWTFYPELKIQYHWRTKSAEINNFAIRNQLTSDFTTFKSVIWPEKGWPTFRCLFSIVSRQRCETDGATAQLFSYKYQPPEILIITFHRK